MSRRTHSSRLESELRILDYLIANETELGLGVSAHHLKTKIPEMPGQTSERLADMLEELAKKGLIQENPYAGDRVLYKISEKGKQEYKEWGIKVLEFYGMPTFKRPMKPK